MKLKKTAEGMTMHGVSRILTTKSRLGQLFWLCFILSFGGLLIYHLITIGKKYFKNLSTTKEETIIASELILPAITICGPSLSNERHSDFKRRVSNASSSPGQVDEMKASFEMLRSIETKENLYSLIADKNEFLLTNLGDCRFGISKKCNYSTDYEEVLVFLRSYCYQFNPHGKSVQRRAGSEFGFSIVMFLNVSDFVKNSFIQMGDAVEILVQHFSEHPFVASGTVLAPTGHLSRIQIGKTQVDRMKAPYPSNCTDGKGFDLIFPGKYTMTNCLESCYGRKSAEVCHGVDFYANAFLPEKQRKQLLMTPDGLTCLDELYSNLSRSNFSSCNCNLPCHETKFDKFVSYSKWPATVDLPHYREVFSKALGLNRSVMTDEFIRNNFLKVSIFYGDMTYRRMKEEKKYSLDNLISDAGGQMGIWLGASMFSIIELFYITGNLIRRVFSQREEKPHTITLTNIHAEK